MNFCKIRRLALALALSALTASCAAYQTAPTTEHLSASEHYRLGMTYESKLMHALALREYEKAAAMEPSEFNYNFAAGNANLFMKRFMEARRWYEAALAITPGNPPALNNMAWTQMELGSFVEAEANARRALASDAAKGHVYLDTLGSIEARRGDLAAAENYLKQAASLAPLGDVYGLMHIYGHLKDLYMRKGDAARAKEASDTLERLRTTGLPR